MSAFLTTWWAHLTTAAAAVIAIAVGLADAWHFHSFTTFDLPAITFGIGLLAGVAPPVATAVAVTPANVTKPGS